VHCLVYKNSHTVYADQPFPAEGDAADFSFDLLALFHFH
jgi:hypothetical protein